jgi:hypothetical protein
MGPFLRSPYVEKDLNQEPWLLFLLNLAKINDPRLAKLAKAAKLAFAALCAVQAVPPRMAPHVTEHLNLIATDNPLAASNILSHSYRITLPLFIQRAVDNPSFFVCIADQFEKFTCLTDARRRLEKRMVGSPSVSDRHLVDTTWSYVGPLLALSLYYLCGDRREYEAHALQLLSNLIVTASVLRHTPDFLPLLGFLGKDWRGNHLSFKKLCQLSQDLSIAFSFCAEAFLSQSLSMKYSALFCCVLEPWFSNVRLSQTESGVIPHCTQTCFTALTFIDAFISVFCKQSTLPPPVIDLISHLNEVDVAFNCAMQLWTKLPAECLQFLTYLCSIHEFLVDNVAQIFTFQYWYYEMVHLTQTDQNFDMDAFLHDPHGLNHSADSFNANSSSLTSFALSLAAELFGISVYAKEKLTPPLLSFCHITKSAGRDAIIEQVTNGSSLDEVLTPSRRERFARCCFEWAVSCGQISHALEASDLTLKSITSGTLEDVEVLLRSLQICVLVAHAIDEFKANPDPNAFMGIPYHSGTTVMTRFYSYIANLVRLLSRMNLFLASPSRKVINVIYAFLATGSSKVFEMIFHAAIDSLHDHVVFGLFIESTNGLLMDIESYEVTPGKIAKTTIEKLCNIIFTFVKAGEFGRLVTSADSKASISAAIIAVLPYAVSAPARFEEVSKVARKFLHIRFTTSLSDNVRQLVTHLTDREQLPLLRFFAAVIDLLPEFASSIYQISSELVSVRSLGPALSKIVDRALREQERSASASACQFLAVCTTCTSIQKVAERGPSVRFPQIAFAVEFSLANIEDHGLPPLVPIDFHYLEIVKTLRETCASFNIAPAWCDGVLGADSVPLGFPLIANVPWGATDVEAFRVLLQTLSKGSKVRRMSSGPNSPDVIEQRTADELLSVNPAVFVPPPEEIGAVSPELGFPIIVPIVY